MYWNIDRGALSASSESILYWVQSPKTQNPQREVEKTAVVSLAEVDIWA
jgi:hypothetical protein